MVTNADPITIDMDPTMDPQPIPTQTISQPVARAMPQNSSERIPLTTQSMPNPLKDGSGSNEQILSDKMKDQVIGDSASESGSGNEKESPQTLEKGKGAEME